MRNLQDIVAKLKHSVQVLNRMASVGFKCKERRIDALDTTEDISSKCSSSPMVSIVKHASSSDSEPESVSNCILRFLYSKPWEPDLWANFHICRVVHMPANLKFQSKLDLYISSEILSGSTDVQVYRYKNSNLSFILGLVQI